MVEYSSHTNLHDSQAMYHRLIQPVYERSVIKHVYDNKISLKSGATAQLLSKRPKTTGYLGQRRYLNDSPSTYWYPKSQASQHIISRTSSRFGQSRLTNPESRSTMYPHLTDERNMKASSQSNTFSATTRVREVPVPGIYKVEIQQFRTRSPSGRGVRAAPLTNRSIIGTHSTRSSTIGGPAGSTHPIDNTCQVSRIQKEQERHYHSREMKRQAQITAHRMDRMYYMNGVTAKLHEKYDIDDQDLERLESIAVARGIKLPAQGSISYSRPSSTYAPASTPRSTIVTEENASSAKTVIPTADVASTVGDATSQEEDDISEHASNCKSTSGKEDAATSDHEDDEEKLNYLDENQKNEKDRNGEVDDSNALQENVKEYSQNLEISKTFFTDLTNEL